MVESVRPVSALGGCVALLGCALSIGCGGDDSTNAGSGGAAGEESDAAAGGSGGGGAGSGGASTGGGGSAGTDASAGAGGIVGGGGAGAEGGAGGSEPDSGIVGDASSSPDASGSDGAPDAGTNEAGDPNRPVALGDAYDALADSRRTVGASVGVLVNDSDPNGDLLEAFTDVGPANGLLTLNLDGSFSYEPTSGFTGTDSFTYVASDGALSSLPATVTLNVLPRVIVVDDAYTVDENGLLVVDVASGVLANDSFTTSARTTNSEASVTMSADGSFTYTPPAGFSGTFVFSYTAEGALGNTDVGQVTITVNNLPEPPIALDDVASTMATTPVVISPLDNDIDDESDPLSLVSVTTPGNGAVVDNGDGTVTYTPNGGFRGVDYFDYTVTDTVTGSDQGRIAVTVDSFVEAFVGTESTDAAIASIVGLDDDSVLAVGTFSGSVTLSPGPGEITLTAGTTPLFVARYDPSGALTWAKAIPAGSFSGATGIDAFSDGSFSITGFFRNTITFDAGLATEIQLQAPDFVRDMDGFVAGFNADGSIRWAHRVGTPTTCAACEKARGVAALSNGTTVATGHTNSGSYRAWVRGYDSSGALLWSDTVSNGRAWTVDAFSDDSIVVAGQADLDIWLRRYSSTGVMAWSKAISDDDAFQLFGPSPEIVQVLSDDTFLVTGVAGTNAVFGAGETNETTFQNGGGYLARYAATGDLSWAVDFPGGVGKTVNQLSGGDLIVVGYGSRPTLAPASPSSTTLDVSSEHSFVARFSPTGVPRYGFTEPIRINNSDTESNLVVFNDGSIGLGGWLRFTSIFGPGETNETTVTVSSSEVPLWIRLFP